MVFGNFPGFCGVTPFAAARMGEAALIWRRIDGRKESPKPMAWWFKAWAERRRDDAQCGRGGERSWSDYVEQREERAEVSGIPGYEAVVGLC